MATEQGIVIKLASNRARVKTTQSDVCKNCCAKNSCSTTGTEKAMEVDAINSAGAQVGDRIVLYFETASLLKASFLLYVFPIIGLLIGALVGHWLSSGLGTNASATAAVFGFGFLVLVFMLARSKANKLARSDRYKPKIIKVLSREPVG